MYIKSKRIRGNYYKPDPVKLKEGCEKRAAELKEELERKDNTISKKALAAAKKHYEFVFHAKPQGAQKVLKNI